MKRKDLIRFIEQAGWLFTSGAKHPDHPGVKIPIPRHTEINDYTAASILKSAGLK